MFSRANLNFKGEKKQLNYNNSANKYFLLVCLWALLLGNGISVASFTNVFNSAILFSVLPPFFFILITPDSGTGTFRHGFHTVHH